MDKYLFIRYLPLEFMIFFGMCSQFIAHRPSPRNKNFTIFLYSKCCGDILGRIRKLIKLTRKLRVISKKSGRFVHQNENCRRTELGNPPLCLQMYTNQNPPSPLDWWRLLRMERPLLKWSFVLSQTLIPIGDFL